MGFSSCSLCTNVLSTCTLLSLIKPLRADKGRCGGPLWVGITQTANREWQWVYPWTNPLRIICVWLLLGFGGFIWTCNITWLMLHSWLNISNLTLVIKRPWIMGDYTRCDYSHVLCLFNTANYKSQLIHKASSGPVYSENRVENVSFLLVTGHPKIHRNVTHVLQQHVSHWKRNPDLQDDIHPLYHRVIWSVRGMFFLPSFLGLGSSTEGQGAQGVLRFSMVCSVVLWVPLKWHHHWRSCLQGAWSCCLSLGTTAWTSVLWPALLLYGGHGLYTCLSAQLFFCIYVFYLSLQNLKKYKIKFSLELSNTQAL